MIYDFLRTTISLGGLGPLSSAVVTVLWRAGRALMLTAERRFGFTIRGLIGPAILSIMAGTWIVLHLAGYTLLYLSGPSLEIARTSEPANLIQSVAFVGAALSTLGASIVRPTNGWWDTLSAIAAINGMIVLTLTVSFVLNIIQSLTRARQWAVRYYATKRGMKKDRAESAAGLGSNLCEIAVNITTSPLTGVFAPTNPTMSFPAALLDLAGWMEARGLWSWDAEVPDPETAQLLYGTGLLGRHVSRKRGDTDFETARRWAEDHCLIQNPES